MLSFQDLQEKLMEDYGIRSDWIHVGGGQWNLIVRIGDKEYMYIGSDEFDGVSQFDVPVSTVAGEFDLDGTENGIFHDVPISDMARMVASEMLARTGMLHP